MYNCLWCAFDSFKSFADDMLSGLSQNLNSYIPWDQILLDQCTQKFIFCFRSSRETYFDFFETDFYKKFEEFNFLFQTHRNHQCLITVTKVYRTPDRCFVHIFFFCPFHAFNRRHKILSLIFAWIHHFFFLRYVNIMFGLWRLTVKRHKKNLPSPQTYLQETKDIIILRGTTLIYEQCHTLMGYGISGYPVFLYPLHITVDTVCTYSHMISGSCSKASSTISFHCFSATSSSLCSGPGVLFLVIAFLL